MAATHSPVQIQGGKDLPFPATYKLSFSAEPGPADRGRLRPGSHHRPGHLAGQRSRHWIQQLSIKAIGREQRCARPSASRYASSARATGGMVDSGASKKIALLVFVAVLALWCGSAPVREPSARRRSARRSRTTRIGQVDIPEDEWSRRTLPEPGDPGPLATATVTQIRPAVDAFASDRLRTACRT